MIGSIVYEFGIAFLKSRFDSVEKSVSLRIFEKIHAYVWMFWFIIVSLVSFYLKLFWICLPYYLNLADFSLFYLPSIVLNLFQ